MGEPKSGEKPFCISKWLVWEAYQRVKANARTRTALKFPGLWGLVSGFLGLVTVWLHVGRGGVTGSGGP